MGFLGILPVPNLGEMRQGEMCQASVFCPAVGYIVGAILVGMARFAAARLGGGLSGDVYGAMVEIGETVGWLLALALTLTYATTKASWLA